MSDTNMTPDPNAEVLPGGLTVGQFIELRKMNPVVAARYQAEHKVSVPDPDLVGPARRIALQRLSPQ